MALFDFLKRDKETKPTQLEKGDFPKENMTLNQATKAVEIDQIKRFNEILQKYKAGKSNLEKRVVNNEKIWKQQQWSLYKEGKKNHIKPANAQLWNAIVSKHADFIDGYPSPNFVPRMEDDVFEAKKLSAIVPVILEQNDFRKVYDDCTWYKLKQGCSVYGIFWNSDADNGLGAIEIKKIDLLKIFFEPGIEDIQDSSYVFTVELVNRDKVIGMYPDLEEQLKTDDGVITKYVYDDTIDTSDKVAIIDVYYKRQRGNKTVLHYCKYCGNNVLYASENETEAPTQPVVNPMTGEMEEVPVGEAIADKGFYAHGMYPFVFDSLFDIEGSPCGYGYIDIGKDKLHQIDVLSQAILTNTIAGARPRYFLRNSGSINEEEFMDLDNPIVHVEGTQIQDTVGVVDYKPLGEYNIIYLNNLIEEMKEITGNRDVNSGGTTSGVTAASAIAAMQEAGGKQSRDGISGTYNAFKSICYQIIELIREFYTQTHEYRIISDGGQQMFMEYTNMGLVPQYQGNVGGIDLGYRTPVFDVEVSAEKASPYKRMERNELAIQLYQLGVFAPQNVDQSVMLLQTMDFPDKDKILDQVRMRGDLYQRMTQYEQIALALASKYEPETAEQLAALIQSESGNVPSVNPSAGEVEGVTGDKSEPSHVERARNEANERTQPK